MGPMDPQLFYNHVRAYMLLYGLKLLTTVLVKCAGAHSWSYVTTKYAIRTFLMYQRFHFFDKMVLIEIQFRDLAIAC